MLEHVRIRKVCYSHLLLSLLPNGTQYIYQENYFLVYGYTVISSSRERHLKNYDAKRTFIFHIQCCNTVKDNTLCPQILFHSSLKCGGLVQWILNIFLPPFTHTIHQKLTSINMTMLTNLNTLQDRRGTWKLTVILILALTEINSDTASTIYIIL